MGTLEPVFAAAGAGAEVVLQSRVPNPFWQRFVPRQQRAASPSSKTSTKKQENGGGKHKQPQFGKRTTLHFMVLRFCSPYFPFSDSCVQLSRFLALRFVCCVPSHFHCKPHFHRFLSSAFCFSSSSSSTLPKNSMKVVIVGGGLVGALEACFLAKRGHTVHLYENRKGEHVLALKLTWLQLMPSFLWNPLTCFCSTAVSTCSDNVRVCACVCVCVCVRPCFSPPRQTFARSGATLDTASTLPFPSVALRPSSTSASMWM